MSQEPPTFSTTLDPGVAGSRLDGTVDRAHWEARYLDLGVLTANAGGELRRLKDRTLDRVVIAKILAGSRHRGDRVMRFLREARVTAQLDHPGILPIYEFGQVPDGRCYYTMKEVRGATFSAVLHASLEEAPGGWPFRRLIDAVRRMGDALGFAHARAVLHRDMKPANVMVGEFGEVYVVDWGLTKILGDPEGADPEVSPDPITTQHGWVLGTPSYMAPEQAHGDLEAISPATDVYGLGAILYETLCGHPPYGGDHAEAVVRAVRRGPPPPLSERAGRRRIPDDLESIVGVAMARDPNHRYPDGTAFARALGDWLDGATARERALQRVDAARGERPRIATLREEAAALRTRAGELLGEVAPWAPIADKRPAWVLQDRADTLELDADLRDLTFVQLLSSALIDAPELDEAHQELAGYYQQRHSEAERHGDRTAAARALQRLSTHDRGRWGRYVSGRGVVTLVTDPPGASIELYKYELYDRRLEPTLVRNLGRTPLRAVELPIGSYLLVLRCPGREPVRYPVRVHREQHWDGLAPGGSEPHPIWLPPSGYLGPDDVYVPAGWFGAGGDPGAYTPLPRTDHWVDAFVMRRFPVTNEEYLAWLNGLVTGGRDEEAIRHVPRLLAPNPGQGAQWCYQRDRSGLFTLVQDTQGDPWHPRWPVFFVDWHDASAYAAHLAARDGLPWRLPGDVEWEKAARGVDRRQFPWGDFFDPSWCNMRTSNPLRPLPVPVEAFPTDVSPYGVRGLAGNARDWCADRYEATGAAEDQHVLRGGAYFFTDLAARSASRFGLASTHPQITTGIRLARSVTPERGRLNTWPITDRSPSLP